MRLRRAFAAVLTATGALGATACGGSTTSTSTVGGGPGGGGPTPEFTPLCEAARTSFLEGLKANPAIDGAVMRTENAFAVTATFGPGGVVPTGADDQGDLWEGTNGESVGNLCATASDPNACREKVQSYRALPATRAACVASYPSPYGPRACSLSYILYTRGDEIGVARNDDEKKALVGAFDTLTEVLWATSKQGYSTACGGYPQGVDESKYRTTDDGGYELTLLKYENCGKQMFSVVVRVDHLGNVTETSRELLPEKPSCSVAGRRPEGLRAYVAAHDSDVVGAYFASMATLEAASVVSFRRLRRELAALGAPAELLDRVREAARDEIRHTRATTDLARRHGVTPSAPEIAPSAENRSVFEVALENAREGCVRETFGALVAHVQRVRAADAEVRACMDAIADEETQHAALSWDVAAWLDTQLTSEERAALADARREALAALASELAQPVDPRVAAVSGIPHAPEALAILQGMAGELLAA